MKDTKNFFTIEEMEKALSAIRHQMKQSKWFPEIILSVNRGGCVPGVYLSHAINVPHKVIDVQLRDDKNKPNLDILEKSVISNLKILVFDDINDTGSTFKYIKNSLGNQEVNVCFAALIDNNSSVFKVDFRGKKIDKLLNPSWIVFPWEKDQN